MAKIAWKKNIGLYICYLGVFIILALGKVVVSRLATVEHHQHEIQAAVEAQTRADRTNKIQWGKIGINSVGVVKLDSKLNCVYDDVQMLKKEHMK